MASDLPESRRPRGAFWSVTVPCLLSFALLAAHAVRSGDWGMAAAWGVMAGLSCTSLAWARLVAMAALFGGGLFWASTGVDLVRFRMAFGMDWLRLAAIMAAVTGLAMAAWWRLAGEAGRQRHHLGTDTAWPRAVAFLLAAGLLWLARQRTASIVLLLSDRFLPGSGPLQIVLAGVYAAWVAGLLLDPVRARKARPRLWALFSAVFFGQLALGLLGAHRLLMTGALHLPVPALILAGPLFRGEGLFMLVLFGVSVLLLGPAWCSHLCYIGAWDDAWGARAVAALGRGAALVPGRHGVCRRMGHGPGRGARGRGRHGGRAVRAGRGGGDGGAEFAPGHDGALHRLLPHGGRGQSAGAHCAVAAARGAGLHPLRGVPGRVPVQRAGRAAAGGRAARPVLHPVPRLHRRVPPRGHAADPAGRLPGGGVARVRRAGGRAARGVPERGPHVAARLAVTGPNPPQPGIPAAGGLRNPAHHV